MKVSLAVLALPCAQSCRVPIAARLHHVSDGVPGVLVGGGECQPLLQIERRVVHLRSFDPKAAFLQPELDFRFAVELDKCRIALCFDGLMRGALDRILAADQFVESKSAAGLERAAQLGEQRRRVSNVGTEIAASHQVEGGLAIGQGGCVGPADRNVGRGQRLARLLGAFEHRRRDVDCCHLGDVRGKCKGDRAVACSDIERLVGRSRGGESDQRPQPWLSLRAGCRRYDGCHSVEVIDHRPGLTRRRPRQDGGRARLGEMSALVVADQPPAAFLPGHLRHAAVLGENRHLVAAE